MKKMTALPGAFPHGSQNVWSPQGVRQVGPGVYECMTCQINISGMAQVNSHLVGEPHRRRLLGETGQQYRCELCGVDLSGELARVQHELGVKHQQRLSRVRDNQLGLCPPLQRPPVKREREESTADYTSTSLLNAAIPVPQADPESCPPQAPSLSQQNATLVTPLQEIADKVRSLATRIEQGQFGTTPEIDIEVYHRSGDERPKWKVTIKELQ